MDTSTQLVVSPVDLGGKQIFVINDIDLEIAPSQIEIRKEDLVFRYRTLRSKVATKVPTGNGQISIHVSIPFVADMLLTMHRLIIELRNSPFCYIDNRFVRESIVPDWPYSQQMAFTITGLSVSNMPNSSNAFILELDATWFNYFPFMHNFLFREEWQTNWLRSDDGSDKILQSATIGWNLNHETYAREFFTNVIAELSGSGSELTSNNGLDALNTSSAPLTYQDRWSVLQNKFVNNQVNRTIFEMEQQHPGVEFDLLPIPGNMMPANLVQQPRYSRIYVRYINFLQRDALLKNFGIDVENDIHVYEQAHNAPGLWESLFKVGTNRDGLSTVLPISSSIIPKSVRQKWINQMTQFSNVLRFHFHAYKELRLPQKLTDSVENRKNQAISDLFARVQAINNMGQAQGTADGDSRAIPVLGAPFPITSEYTRNGRIHPSTGKWQQIHSGTDFGAPRGTPLYTPEDGTILKMSNNSHNGNYVVVETQTGKWYYCHMDLFDPAIFEGATVPAGTQIGTVGNTGITNAVDASGNYNPNKGYHLHLTLYPSGSTDHTDPLPYLQDILDRRESESASVTAPSPLLTGTEPAFDYGHENPSPLLLTDEQRLEQAAATQAQQSLQLTDQETDALTDLMNLLDSEGWAYYDSDSTVTNIWKKLFSLEIRHSGLDQIVGRSELPEDFVQKGIVLTSISGSLSHLVSNIPILSHEFPTQQHLGSVEPEFQFEFAVLDDKSDLEGISAMGQLVQGMRSILQSNSRRFRPVMDGWCVATDTFITRLFGSYQNNDFRVLLEDNRVNDAQLKKRTTIANSYDATIPGNPGLSTITMNLQETNPYVQENLIGTAPVLADKELARSQVLNAVYNLELAPEYRDLLLPLFVAQRLKANLTDANASDFGMFSLKTVSGPFNAYVSQAAPDLFLYEGDGTPKLLLRANDPNELDFLRMLGVESDYFYSNDVQTGFIQLDPNQLDGWQIGTLDYGLYNGVAYRPYQPSTTSSTGLSPDIFNTSLFQFGPEDSLVIYDNTKQIYDISVLAEQNPALAMMPVSKLVDYYLGIISTIDTADRVLAETEVGGVTKDYTANELYQLPIKQDMWKSWQMYLEEFIKLSSENGPNVGLMELHQNPAFPMPNNGSSNVMLNSGRGWNTPLPEYQRPQFSQIAESGFGVAGTPSAGLMDAWWLTDPRLEALGYIGKFGLAMFSSDYEIAGIYRDKHETAIGRLVNRYMNFLPLNVNLPDYLKDKYATIIGSFIGNTDANAPGLASMRSALYANAYSCGNITYDFHSAISLNPIWQDETAGAEKSGRAVMGGVLGALGFPVAALEFTPAGLGVKVGSAAAAAVGIGKSTSLSQIYSQTAQSTVNGLTNLGYQNAQADLYPSQLVGNVLDTPFVYPTEQASEQEKVHQLKELLAAIADDILGDYRMLQMLGLTHLMFADENREYAGIECYPDLDLPSHPYYGSRQQVYPDFYMWNIYEDGHALEQDQLEAIYEQVDFVIHNAYESMKRMSIGDRYDERQDTVIPEVSVDDPIVLATQMTPEGTDGQHDGTGPTDSPFAKVNAAKDATSKFAKDAADKGFSPRLFSDKPGDYIQGIRLANNEGNFGQGGGLHYPRRTSRANYDELRKQLSETTQMFGSSEGYLNRDLNAKNTPTIFSAIKGTNLERPPEPTHLFDEGSLKKLARDSAKDLISHKMSLKRAFPTFKLYFVEEDEFETRFINFDDFYSYNAVKEMTVVQSRKSSADHAVITLQNINGTLDGTRRNAIVDLDYYTGTSTKTNAARKAEAHEDNDASLVTGDPVTMGTQSDQPFGAVVLRPGLNVQLRMGFANDPNNLHVMISGRVVDVTWNKTGDLAEIMLQSFGTELEQVIKGTQRDENVVTYYTTHELLGSLMLEPEVVHFGRWEFGQQFQVGEAKDHRLDFTDYARQGYLGTFAVTSWVSQWITNHPWLTLGLVVGASTAHLFSWGRILGSSSALGGVAEKLGIGLAQGKAGYTAVFTEIAGEKALEGATKVAAFEAAGKILTPLAESAIKKVGQVEFTTALNLRVAEYAAEFAKATTLEEHALASAKLESYIQSTVFRARWMAKPWVEVTGATFMSSVGFKPLGTLLGLYTGVPLKIGAATLGVAAAIDILGMIFRPLYQYTIGGARKFFARTRAQIFLTPQDDNLFPPSPKDYMTLDQSWIRRLTQLATNNISLIFTGDTDPGLTAFRFIYPDEFISKKVAPDDCQYHLSSTTIWDVFREMSMRHPGWIYGPRPYGNTFRYTMFFGVPSQRYWARPASNAFITRSNDLRRFLDNRFDEFSDGNNFLISDFEFRALYGDKVYDELKKQVDTQFPALTSEHVFNSTAAASGVNVNSPPNELNWFLALGGNAGIQDVIDKQKAANTNAFRAQMTAIAIREYLRSVQIRFEPFRRYHLLTSERDIVWNGIMGSEQAVINAVDIAYFPKPHTSGNDFSGQIKTSIFKAHSFIPEHKLRIAPVRWYNCIGYGMAQRYAMGELMDRMKDMYRGELIVLGNPRIRPWDVGIVVDSYNDMVGPIEVEQVVHTFSHETGYLTEVKPSALCFANEISGWPLVEGMKLFAMAIQDIHKRYEGIKADDGDNRIQSLANAAAVLTNKYVPGPTSPVSRGIYDSFLDEKFNKLFGDGVSSLDNQFGNEPPPDLDVIDHFASDLVRTIRNTATGVGLVGSALALTGGVISAKSLYSAAKEAAGSKSLTEFLASAGSKEALELGRLFLKKPLGLVAGAQLLTGLGFGTLAAVGFGAPLIISQFDFPGSMHLLGSSVLFLQCLRNDAVILVPLIKSGNPIVAGLAYNDPALVWKGFRGTLNRMAQDTINGTSNLLSLYKRYGSAVWQRVNQLDLGTNWETAHQSVPLPLFPATFNNPQIIEGLTGGEE